MPDFSQSHDVFWRRIASADPAALARATGVTHDAERCLFSVPLLGDCYSVDPVNRRIANATLPQKDPAFDVKVILVTYLASGISGSIAGEWVGEQSLPGGSIFFRGTHELPKNRLIAAIGNDISRLSTAAAAAGGTPFEATGDLSVEFAALPRVPLRLIYWKDDGEFPPSVTFLFDRGASTFLPLDGLLALVNVLVKKLVV